MQIFRSWAKALKLAVLRAVRGGSFAWAAPVLDPLSAPLTVEAQSVKLLAELAAHVDAETDIATRSDLRKQGNGYVLASAEEDWGIYPSA